MSVASRGVERNPGPSSAHTANEVSSVEPDWSREQLRAAWDPGRQLLRSIRQYQAFALQSGPIGFLGRYWNVLMHRFWSAITGADIPLNVSIGGGLLIPHPNGIVIHPDATIGPNCLIFHQVTLGTGGTKTGSPQVGGHVDIGAGAKVLGGIRLGDHCKIGANAVVLADVPPGATAVGIPARVIPAGAELDTEQFSTR